MRKGGVSITTAITRAAGPSAGFPAKTQRFRGRLRLSDQRRSARIAGERYFGEQQYHSIPVLGGVTGAYWYNALVTDPTRIGNSIEQSQALAQLRQGMRTPVRRRQLRGLVLHHRRHPAEHPRRLVNRTASWGEPPVNGICRWCYELTASPRTRWHRYCLNAYRVASGQHPDEIQHTLCEICGDPSDEMDHRLAIEVAHALGPTAMLRRLCRRSHGPGQDQAQGGRGNSVTVRNECYSNDWTF